MELEYAKPMTKSQIDAFFADLENQRISEYKRSLHILNRYRDVLISEHQFYDELFRQKCRRTMDERARAFDLRRKGLCECGAKVTYIREPYCFWGCTNYHDTSVNHRNYIDKDIERYFPLPVPNHWIADIRAKIGLPKSLRTGHIYRFYLEEGLEDLLLKYTDVSTETYVYKLCDTRNKAKEFEKSCYESVSALLTKCSFQFAIRYKYFGQKERFAFIDILGSDNDFVYIYECKTSQRVVNICQQDLYVDLVSRILKDNNINKPVKFTYLFEEGE